MSINGVYKSQNGQFILEITDADEGKSTFGGTLISVLSPVGEQKMGVTGRYYYTGPGTSPLNLGLTAASRPDSREYSVVEAWCGVFTAPGEIKMSGSQSYLAADGAQEQRALGTQIFVK